MVGTAGLSEVPAESLPPSPIYLCSPSFLHRSQHLPTAARPVASRRISSTRTGARMRTFEWGALQKAPRGCHQAAAACCAPDIPILSPSHVPCLSQGDQRAPGTNTCPKGPQSPRPTPGDTSAGSALASSYPDVNNCMQLCVDPQEQPSRLDCSWVGGNVFVPYFHAWHRQKLLNWGGCP